MYLPASPDIHACMWWCGGFVRCGQTVILTVLGVAGLVPFPPIFPPPPPSLHPSTPSPPSPPFLSLAVFSACATFEIINVESVIEGGRRNKFRCCGQLFPLCRLGSGRNNFFPRPLFFSFFTKGRKGVLSWTFRNSSYIYLSCALEA